MANNFKLENLTQEQIANLLAFAQQNGIDVNPVTKKKQEIDNLHYIDEEKTQAQCVACNTEFTVADVDSEVLIESKKSGLCPHCLQILLQAKEIESKMIKVRTRKFVDNRPSEDKPGYKIRVIIQEKLSKIDRKLLKQLQDLEFCKKNFKLAFSMFLNISNKTSDEIKILRKDSKGHVRYSSQVYEINNQQLLLTNDLYEKNLPLIADFFSKL